MSEIKQGSAFMDILFPILAAEILVLFAFWLFCYCAIRKKMIKNDLIVAKLFIARRHVWQYVWGGIVWLPIILIASLFQNSQKAAFLRFMSAVPFIILSGIGLVYGLWVYFTLKAPPSAVNDDAIEAFKNGVIDNVTGWPLKPAFSYGRHGWCEISNIVIMLILLTSMGAFMFLSGGATLLIVMAPDILPETLAANLLRSAHDGPIADGLLLLSFGTLTLVGGGALVLSAWKKFLEKRPISINTHGIYTFYRGSPWKFYAWNDVQLISKLRSPNGYGRIRIKGTNFILLITPQISNFVAVCKIISQYARDNTIKLQLIDQGQDTIRAHKNTVPNEEYKKIAREGLISDITELYSFRV